ncbi:MAG: hypothetical protein ABSA83_19065 [Verrucomicrobiota bacterium]|jgi:hypothetical protein
MKRREFLTSSIAAAGLGTIFAGANAGAQEAATPGTREFYELRLYHLRRGPQTELFDRFYSDAAIAENTKAKPNANTRTLPPSPGLRRDNFSGDIPLRCAGVNLKSRRQDGWMGAECERDLLQFCVCLGVVAQAQPALGGGKMVAVGWLEAAFH